MSDKISNMKLNSEKYCNKVKNVKELFFPELYNTKEGLDYDGDNYDIPQTKNIYEITQEEKDVLFKIARRIGCDSSGDILRMYINEQLNRIRILIP